MDCREGNHPQANERRRNSPAEAENLGFIPRGPARENRRESDGEKRAAPVPQPADARQPVVSGKER